MMDIVVDQIGAGELRYIRHAHRNTVFTIRQIAQSGGGCPSLRITEQRIDDLVHQSLRFDSSGTLRKCGHDLAH
ncbi:MAG: hypothetical protein U0528_02275 [Anaerolineae bacterium]